MRARNALLMLLVPAAVAACGGGGLSAAPPLPTPSTGASATTQTPVPTPAPRVAPAAQLTLTGGAGLTGAFTPIDVECRFPTLDGSSQVVALYVYGKAADSTSVALFVYPGRVRARTFANGSFSFFEGPGVAQFDPAAGAVLDARLSSTSGSSGPAVTAVAGRIDCGNQTAGTASLTVAGTTAFGPISGSPTQVLVVCRGSGTGANVTIEGFVHFGSTPAWIEIVANADASLNVSFGTPTGSDAFNGKNATPPTDRVHLDATVKESSGQGTLQLAGDAICG